MRVTTLPASSYRVMVPDSHVKVRERFVADILTAEHSKTALVFPVVTTSNFSGEDVSRRANTAYRMDGIYAPNDTDASVLRTLSGDRHN